MYVLDFHLQTTTFVSLFVKRNVLNFSKKFCKKSGLGLPPSTSSSPSHRGPNKISIVIAESQLGVSVNFYRVSSVLSIKLYHRLTQLLRFCLVWPL